MGITILDQHDKEELNKKIDDAKKETAKQIDEAIKNSTGPIDPSRIKDMYYTEDGGGNEIFPETTISFADEPTPISVDLGLTVGETYTVKWNGVEYTCVAQEFVSPDGPVVGVCIGNLGQVTDGADTGEPFIVIDHYPEMAVAIGAEGMVTAFDGSESVTMSIMQKKSKIHQIPPKYIKDMYYTEDGGMVEILPESMAVASDQAIMGELYVMGKPITLEVGKIYKVVYNGTEYESVASVISIPTIGEGIGLGDVDVLSTGVPAGTYPFVIATADALTNIGASIAVIPLSITRDIELPIIAIYGNPTVVHHIPPKYIKDMYYVDGTEEVVILPEITVPSNTQIPLNQPFDAKVGETYICIVDGVEYECTAIEVGAFIGATFSVTLLGNTLLLNGKDTGEPFYFIASTNEIEAGAYGIAQIDNNKETATVSIKQVIEKIHKLDNKYLDLDWLPIYKENPIAAFDCTTDNNISGGSVVDGMKPVSTGVVSSVLTNLNYNKTVTLDNLVYPAAIITIVLDGVSYDAYCMHMDNHFMIRFDTDMKPLPFVIYNNISGEKLYFGAVVDGDHTVTISAKEPNKIPEDFLPGETKPATTIVDLDGYDIKVNELYNISAGSIRNEMLSGLRNKNLILTNVRVYNGEQIIASMENLVMSNYYETNSTRICASATFNDYSNAYVLNIIADIDGSYTNIKAHRISYDTWTGGSY